MEQVSVGSVFMSYSRRDHEVMQRIVAFLRKQGIKAWVDNEKLIPGTPIWEEEIEKAIKGASAVIVVLSPDAKNSEWVRREISLADQNRKRIFPVLVRGNEDSSITLRLITRQYVDIRENEIAGLNALYNSLVRYLSELQAELDQNDREKPKAENKAQKARLPAEQRAEVEGLAREWAEAERNAQGEQLQAKQKAEEELSTGRKKSRVSLRSMLVRGGLLVVGLVALVALVSYNNELNSRKDIATARARNARKTVTAEAQKQDALVYLAVARAWPPVFTDDFTANTLGWYLGNISDTHEISNRLITNGKFRWEEKAVQDNIAGLNTIAAGPITNFYLTMEASRTSGNGDSGFEYGLMIRVEDKDNYYAYLIYDDDCWRFYRIYDGEYSFLEGDCWAGIQDGAVNRLAIIAEGSHFIFFINDQYVGEADDDLVSGERVGIRVILHQAGDEAVFEFDNFELRSLDATIGEVTPTAPVPPEATSIQGTTTPPCDSLTFVEDVTVPDDTIMSPGQDFIKTWRVKNIGSCPWGAGYELVYAGYSDELSGRFQPLTEVVQPGQFVEISVQFRAPDETGEYISAWQMRNPAGITFPHPIYVKIIVQ